MLLKRDLLLYLKLVKLKCLSVPDNVRMNRTHTIRPTSTPLGNNNSVLHSFLGLCDEMRHIFTHTSVSTLRRKERFEKLWKIQKILEILYSIFSKVYNTSRDQATEKFVFLFKGKAVFKLCIAKKYQFSRTKTYKLCNSTGYTCNIKVYLRKDRQCPAQQLTAAHATVS
jgi:hypothetical protein